MKKFLGFVVILGILGLCLTGSASANLTKQDIEEIRKIVREEVQREIQSVKVEIQYVNKRIDDLTNLLYVILAGMFALVGFVLWDRRTALAPAVRKAKELEEEEEKIKKVLKEYSRQQPKMEVALRQAGLL